MAIDISNTTRRIVYTGSAGTGPYAFEFEVLAQTDIAVYFNDTELELTTDYTVSIGVDGTGSITIVTGTGVPTTPDANDRITIIGDRTIERTTDFTTGGPLFATSLNDEFDSQTIFVQQVQEQADRGLRAPNTDPTTINMTLPKNVDRANKTLAFDENGNPTIGEQVGDYRGNWSSGVEYNKRDLVKDTSNENVYICLTAHTSSGSLPIDSNADAAKWAVLVDAESVQDIADAAEASATDAEAAQTAAEAAQALAETAQTAAELAQTGAETAETNAETAQTGAETAQGLAEAAQAAAEAVFDNFDDAYLGSKASDPTLDNDGNALADGALYFNTTSNIMKVYDLGTTTWYQLTPSVENQTNINTVAGISADVTTVAGIESDVTTVAADGTDIGTVATNIANVNTVAGISADVSAVAANETNINAVNANETNINAVNANSTNINTVAGISANVTDVANNETNINAVNANETNINTTATNIANVNTTATNIANVNTTATNIANVNTTATNIADVNTVAGISSNVTTVAGLSSDIASVVADQADIGTVAGISADVTTVAGISSDVTTVADNLVDVTTFADLYLGAASSAPTATTTGALYFDTTADQLYVWDGSAWQEAAFSVTGAVTSFNTRTGAVTLSATDVNNALGSDAVLDSDIGSTVQAYDATILKSADIGTSVQGYDADTAKYDDVTANFTGTLQNGGSNVLVDTDIGSTVQAYDATIVVDADIGVTVQGYDADTAKYDDVTANFTGNLQKSGANVLTANQTITLSGDLSGSGTTSINAQLGANVVNANELNVTGNGTTSQYLRSDGDGTFTWATPPDTTANQTITLSGDVSGSGTTSITVTVADDSHNHIISNVDGLQTALDGKQPLDADLTAIGGLANTDGNFIVGNGSTWVAESGATARTSLGLGSLSTLNEVNASTIADNSVGADELNVSGNGTAGQYLASDGDGTMTWTTLAAGGGFSNIEVFTSPGTWTNPGSVEKVKVTVVAAGGGGGLAAPIGPTPSKFYVYGGGGGAGGASIEVIPFPSGTNVPVTIGTGGTGTGGTSSFGAYCSATGGSAGGNLEGGVGGVGSGGSINLAGQGGGSATSTLPSSAPTILPTRRGGGAGGSSLVGGGGATGTSGTSYGGGSGGASSAAPSAPGPTRSGANGVVIVEY